MTKEKYTPLILIGFYNVVEKYCNKNLGKFSAHENDKLKKFKDDLRFTIIARMSHDVFLDQEEKNDTP